MITLCGLESYGKYKVYQIYECVGTKPRTIDLKFKDNAKFLDSAEILKRVVFIFTALLSVFIGA